VIGFNDRPELIEDFTSSVEDIQARLATVHAGHRTALLDAIYYGIAKMSEAHHDRKALLVVSDGGDNRSRYTEGEVRAQVREADVEIYSIGIFDPYAPTPEERTGPQLLDDISSSTGGRLFRVDDIDEIVRAVRFDGWQTTHAGEREVKMALRKTLFKYKLHQDADLFERAYGYIREYY